MGQHSRRKTGKLNKKYEPHPDVAKQVMAMTGYGITQEEIATVLDIHPKTLRRYYRRELDTGAIEANARIAQALFKNAVQNENVAAQIWWTKSRMGWKEARDLNIGGTETPLAIDFRWADDPVPTPVPKQALTIEADADEPMTVTFETETAGDE